jgi:hypothetical protein
MKILFNYAHNKFLNSQIKNTQTGKTVGLFDKVYQFRFDDIDLDFYQKNKHILDLPRGAGYWIWKYYFALKILNDPNTTEDDYIFYCDSGSHFINSIDPMVDVFERDKLSVMTYLQLHKASKWTKRDMFILTDSDEPKFTETGLRVGGFFMFKKNNISFDFFSDCLKYAQDYRIITDCPNECGLPNYPDFVDHRHDEALISIISKKYNLYPYRNPCQYGIDEVLKYSQNEYTKSSYEKHIKNGGWDYGTFEQYPYIINDDKSDYPTIINLTRDML